MTQRCLRCHKELGEVRVITPLDINICVTCYVADEKMLLDDCKIQWRSLDFPLSWITIKEREGGKKWQKKK